MMWHWWKCVGSCMVQLEPDAVCSGTPDKLALAPSQDVFQGTVLAQVTTG